MVFEMARASKLIEVYIEGLLVVWTHGMAPALVATLNMMSLMVAHILVIGLYPFHDTVACMLNGTGAIACVRLHPLFGHHSNITRDMLALHHTIQSIADTTVHELKSTYYWGSKNGNVLVCGK
jgi:hypothetical protein